MTNRMNIFLLENVAHYTYISTLQRNVTGRAKQFPCKTHRPDPRLIKNKTKKTNYSLQNRLRCVNFTQNVFDDFVNDSLLQA